MSLPLVSALTGADVLVAVPLFLAATAVVAGVAPRLTTTVEKLARRTSFGSSLAGSVLLGASTSLPGIIVTVVATLRGDVVLAAANAVGGVVAQTSFLAVADLTQRRGDLFRNAVSPKALTQLGFLLVLLAVPLFAIAGWPAATVGRVHVASGALVVIYVVGLWVARHEPAKEGTSDGNDDSSAPLWHLWAAYAAYVLAVGAAGFVIGTTISPISQSLGLTSVAAGALLTAGATSSPELITAVTAARRRKLSLAVGDIVGGNTFDVLFLAVADVALAASLYGRLGSDVVLLLAIAILLNALLLLGLVRRRGKDSVSPESWVIIAAYVALAVLLLTAPPGGG